MGCMPAVHPVHRLRITQSTPEEWSLRNNAAMQCRTRFPEMPYGISNG
jgi:hypothetical protein